MLDSRGGRAFGGVMPNYEYLYKTNSPEWTNGNSSVKILGEDLKQSLKAHLRFHPYLRETKNLSITFALFFMSKFNCNCQ